ncbi:MAG: ketoacyl-ACP synthase III [Chitinivibrionales bacterium]|nr:ketoacyl-ACP synthase III [Chitinivibrionales bacterium]
MTKINLVSIGAYVPDKILNNAQLETMVDTSDTWIRERTGIKERRIAEQDVVSHDMATHAARHCLSRFTIQQPDLLISSSCTPGRLCPYQASIVSNRLNLKPHAAFDINAACSGLLYGLQIAQSMMNNGTALFKHALITAAEKMSSVTDYTDRNTCILFGDGASAMLISREGGDHELVAVETGFDSSRSNLISMGGKNGDYYFRQDGRQVYRFAVSIMDEMIDRLLQKCGLTVADHFYVIPHQANLRVMQAVAEKKKIPFNRFITNIEKYGNTSSASIGIALEQAWSEGVFQKGDHVLLLAFGGGLSWAGAVIRW